MDSLNPSFDLRRQNAISAYPAHWRQMFKDWQGEGEDAAWLIYSANYLFRTAGIHWAMDPMTLWARLGLAVPVNLAMDLSGLDFLVLTHRHADHYDRGLLSALAVFPIPWVVPEFMLQYLSREVARPAGKIIPIRAGEAVEIGGVKLTSFEGMHWAWKAGEGPGFTPINGVPSMGYLVEFSGKRWLLPGDTRTYNVRLLPDFGLVDGLIAHVWLGKGAALENPPPLLDEFCNFCADLKPGRLVLAHLDEWGRDAEEVWDGRHAVQVQEQIKKMAPEIRVDVVYVGDMIDLDFTQSCDHFSAIFSK